jgi:glycosyltransferase involved in cell wall biosynthesis
MNELIPNNKSISIIVCCYNGEHTIETCLESLKNQDRDDISIEVILVDDGSKDKTAEKIATFLSKNRGFKNLEFKYYRKENGGLSIARNYGLSKSTGTYVAYIDEDAFAYPDFAQNVINVFYDNPEINCVGGQVELLNDDLEFPLLLQYTFFASYMKNPLAVIGTNMSYRRDFLLRVGGFQPEFTYRGDESALFKREKNKIKILQTESVKVKHNQSYTLKDYLKTRYENGYFGAAIDHLTNLSFWEFSRKMMVVSLTLFLPILIVLTLFLIEGNEITYFLTFIYGFILLRRFVFNGLLKDLFGEYNRNKEKHGSNYSIYYLGIVAFYGLFKTDFGYFKGYFAYRNQKWKDAKKELKKLTVQKTVPYAG